MELLTVSQHHRGEKTDIDISGKLENVFVLSIVG